MVEVGWKQHLDELRSDSLDEFFGVQKPIIGMVHLWPLPGAPGYSGHDMDKILEQARRDTEVLLEGGVDGLIVENMWDLPYYVGADVQIEAVAAQAVAARAVAEMASVPVGVNVIHNGWEAELAIAVAAGLDFMRICILTGARLWDTGDLNPGCAADLLRRRKELGAEHLKLFADVDKKHS
ncbi:MAG: BtpA/SgcQ family protein, partial [Anaerolineae bacterium]